MFVDIDDSLGMDPDDMAARINPAVRAVVPVHILGSPCRIDTITETARREGLMVIEDCAQSLGAELGRKKVGTFGHLGAFSLQLGKIITAGEGGAVVTDDQNIYYDVIRVHDQGQVRGLDKSPLFFGENYRMSELTGAVALAQMRKLDSILSRIRFQWSRLRKAVKPLEGFTLRQCFDEGGDAGTHLSFRVLTRERALWVQAAIGAEGIPIFRLYNGEPVYFNQSILNQKTRNRAQGIHRLKTCATFFPCPFKCPLRKHEVEYGKGLCPEAERNLPRMLFIPLGPLYTDQDVNDIIFALEKVHDAYQSRTDFKIPEKI